MSAFENTLVSTLGGMLLLQYEVKMLATFVYTFRGLANVRGVHKAGANSAFIFIAALMQSAGGGIVIPLLMNKTPAPFVNDMLVMTLIINMAVQHFAPSVVEIATDSTLINALLSTTFEIYRANGVCGAVKLGNSSLPASLDIGFPLFGPIFMGSIAGCAGGFLPLSKGLDPLKAGCKPNMKSGFAAAIFFHFWLNVWGGDAAAGQILVALFFIVLHVGLFLVERLGSKGKGSERSEKKATKAPAKAAPAVVKLVAVKTEDKKTN